MGSYCDISSPNQASLASNGKDGTPGALKLRSCLVRSRSDNMISKGVAIRLTAVGRA